MLTLPIKKKWFDMITSGEKKEEYREIKPYYHSRMKKAFGVDYKDKKTEVKFVNGYGNNKPTIVCEVKLRIGQGKEEWGAEPNKKYYILEILEIMKGK